jgi:tRNA-dihydrouridine synthase A
MMDWTDRHCRFFHRLLSARALLYTEMITAEAVLHGKREMLLAFSAEEQPVALQLGGSDPVRLAEAAAIGEGYGYGEINLNVGCPSDRVQEGRFGACLMTEPDLVARSVAAMAARVSVPVTVKCRIGIDDQDSERDLERFVSTVAAAGCRTFIVHARKAWLQGLSPKENREVPPLDYDRVYRLKAAHPELQIIINGGIMSLDEAQAHLAKVDGVGLGRAAYQNPYLLADVDTRLFGAQTAAPSRRKVIEGLVPYVERHLSAGGRLNNIARHILGLYHGRPRARAFRRHIAEQAPRDGAGAAVLLEAMRIAEGDILAPLLAAE